MTDQHLTHLYFLLDRSGSMQGIVDDTVGGFDAFVAEQRAVTRGGAECRVTLAQFDDAYGEVYADRPIADVGSLVLKPRGTTALLDSIGRLVVDAGQRLARIPEDRRPGTVVVGIMTDGLENASREWTHRAVRALVEQQSTTNAWQFLYMGADQDAIEVGHALGVRGEHAVTYGRGNVEQVLAASSAQVSDLRRARSLDPAAAMRAYTTQEREAASRD